MSKLGRPRRSENYKARTFVISDETFSKLEGLKKSTGVNMSQLVEFAVQQLRTKTVTVEAIVLVGDRDDANNTR